MRKILLFFGLLLICKVSLFASHIVGGEFELLHVQDFTYRLNMILYFDELYGEAGAKDPTVTAYIYRKSDNTLVRSVLLTLSTDELVPYSNTDCDEGELVTSRIFYTTTLTLPAEDFSDPEGYYVAWERCCRNYNIKNIRSDEPGTGISAGQTFYLEFPPVTKNGEPFVNSTPRLFPPLSDYGGVDKFYFVDFGGEDADGDSLSYSMVTPYSTIDTQNAFPASPNPGPYPEIVWESGFSFDNIMGGDPDLAISSVGLLTVTPKNTGLYVFAVKCEEYRDGEKIGEVRRDFQMLVIPKRSNQDPVIRARESGDTEFYNEEDVLNFNYADDNKCIEILVNDVPLGDEELENVTIRAIPINFEADLGDLGDFPEVALTSSLDTAKFTVCFPDCPYTRSGFYQIGIIGYDDACAQPALDTVVVSVNIPPPPNTVAYYADAKGAGQYSKITKVVTASADGNLTLPIKAWDDDNDTVTLAAEPIGFDMAQAGMTLSSILEDAGAASTTLNWDFDCDEGNVNLSAGRDVSTGSLLRKAFDILFTAEDADECAWEDPRTLLVTLIIEFHDQHKPVIFESNNPGQDMISFNYQLKETANHKIKATDQDNEVMIMSGNGINFNFEDYGVSFEEKQGTASLISDFLWTLSCELDITQQEKYTAEFRVEDVDACQLTNQDTLLVDFFLYPPPSTQPSITFGSANELEIKNDSIGFILGQELQVNVQGIDVDGDSIKIVLLNNDDLPGLSFESTEGVGQVLAPLNWSPDCSIFTDDSYSEDFELRFLVQDRNCYLPRLDTATLVAHIEDKKSKQGEFNPPNLFTPNGDEVNEFFGMYRQDEDAQSRIALVNILPIDNCAGAYEGVVIYNRWGRSVFESEDRDFKWDGGDQPAGVYYYHVKFSNRDFKGWVSMIK